MPLFRPGKPRIVRRLTSDQAAGATPTPVQWDVDESLGEWASLTSTTIEVAIDGYYVCTFGIGHTAGTGAQPASGRLDHNGLQVAQCWSDSSANFRAASGAWAGNLVAGDTILLAAVGALTGGKLMEADVTRLTLARLGPVAWT